MAYALAVVAVEVSNVANLNSPGFSTLDGVNLTPLAPCRILLVGQTTTSQNGVWIWNGSSTPLARPTAITDEYKSGANFDNATLIPVTSGTNFAGTVWGVDPAQVITVDTTGHTLMRVALPPVQVKCATTTNIDLTATWTTIDGVSLNYSGNKNTGAQGSDLVLVRNQATPSQNGLYWANASGAMVRTTEPLPPNREVQVSEGTVWAHSPFRLATQGAIVIGTTSLTFARPIVRANVREFGAVGDGVTDDSTAIENAVAAVTTKGGTVLFPLGTYLIGPATGANFVSNVQLAFEEGAVIAGSVAFSVNGRITAHGTQQIFGNFLNGTVTATGTTPPTITPNGFANAAYQFKVVVTTTGALGAAVFEYSLQNGAAGTYVTGITVPSNGVYVVPGTGVTIIFSVGTYTAGGTPDTYTWSTTAASAVTLSNTVAVEIPVKWFGAQGNEASATNGAITSGSQNLTSPTTFTSADVGKNISVAGAGTSGANLVTTILSVSGGAAKLSAAAGTTVSSASVVWGNDDSTAISNASSAISGAGGAIQFTTGLYYVGSSISVAATVRTQFQEGAILAPVGSTVTLNGRVEAHQTQQIFAGAGSIAITSKANDRLSVMWWGAQGNGTGDDSVPINAAIQAYTPVVAPFYTDGGIEIHLPAGTYALSHAININRLIVLTGAGGHYNPSTILVPAAGIQAIVFHFGDTYNVTIHTPVAVSNVTWNGTAVQVTATGHGRSTGDYVLIANVMGYTAANGSFQITKIDANNFTLNGLANPGQTYTSGGSVWGPGTPNTDSTGSIVRDLQITPTLPTAYPTWQATHAYAPGTAVVPTTTSPDLASPSTNGFYYVAIQGTTQNSGSSEPAWPTSVTAGLVGTTVVDGGVTWEARELPHAVRIYAAPVCERICVKCSNVNSATGDGFYVGADATSIPITQASLSRFDNCIAEYCQNGFSTQGGDASVSLFNSCVGKHNLYYAFMDGGFFGSTFVACQTEDNGGQGLNPLTNIGGGYLVRDANAEGALIGCYSESGDWSYILGATVTIGGLLGGGLDPRSTGYFMNAFGMNVSPIRVNSNWQNSALTQPTDGGFTIFVGENAQPTVLQFGKDGDTEPVRMTYYDDGALPVWSIFGFNEIASWQAFSFHAENNREGVGMPRCLQGMFVGPNPQSYGVGPTHTTDSGPRFTSYSPSPNTTPESFNALMVNFYRVGDIVLNSDPVGNGVTQWICTSRGAFVTKTWATGFHFLGDFITDGSGNTFRSITKGNSGASAPSWNTSYVGQTTTDGTVTWEYFGPTTASFAPSSIFAGITSVSVASGSYTPAITGSIIEATGTLTGNANVNLPNIAGTAYDFYNGTSGAHVLTFVCGTGSLTIAQGKRARGYVNGSGNLVRVSPDT